MPEAIANTVRFTGLPLSEVVPMACAVPARVMDIPVAGTVLAEWDVARLNLRVIDVVE
jgi:N-acetylglucosamine-6-phosphate deacetylase